jgi:hypothetical protein
MVDVDAADDDAAVRAGALVVEQGRDPAGDRKRDREAERREHHPLPARAQMLMQMETLRAGVSHAAIVAGGPADRLPSLT